MDAQLWTAVLAAVVGPTVAVLVSIWSFWFREESQRASRHYLEDGAEKLLAVLSARISAYMMNYQSASFAIRSLREYNPDARLRPRDLPALLDVNLDSLPLELILPVQELVGDRSVYQWVILMLSDLTLFAKDADSQIRQPLVAIFNSMGPIGLDRDEAVKRLTALLESWNKRIEAHYAILDRLNDLISFTKRNRPWTFRGYARLTSRREMRDQREKWQEGLKRVEEVRETARQERDAALNS